MLVSNRLPRERSHLQENSREARGPCPFHETLWQHGQKPVPTGHQGHFFDFPDGEQPFIKGFDPRVEARGHERAHRQDGAPVRPASPNGAPAPQGPTVAIERGHTD